MALASRVNQYLDVNAPWFEIKTSKENAAKSVYTAIAGYRFIEDLTGAIFTTYVRDIASIPWDIRVPCLEHNRLITSRMILGCMQCFVITLKQPQANGKPASYRKGNACASHNPCLKSWKKVLWLRNDSNLGSDLAAFSISLQPPWQLSRKYLHDLAGVLLE